MTKKLKAPPHEETNEVFNTNTGDIVVPDALQTELICGLSVNEIRKVFFEKRVSQMLDEIQAKDDINESELERLTTFLETLEATGKKNKEYIQRRVKTGFNEVSAPTVDQLTGDEVVDEAQLAKWEEVTVDAVQQVKNIIVSVGNAAKDSTNMNKQQLMNFAERCTGLLYYINQRKLYKKQVFKKRLTNMIDDYGISRREAEDRAEVTKEYREWKELENLYDLTDTFIQNCKKQWNESYN